MSTPSALEEVLSRDRQVVTVLLLIVITSSWLYLLSGAGTGMLPHEIMMLAWDQVHTKMMNTGAWTAGYSLLMFSMWWLMMVAMMLPSAAPMILLHAEVTRRGLTRKNPSESLVATSPILPPTTAFVAGYLIEWGLFSLAAVIIQWALERGGLLSAMMMPTDRYLSAGLLFIAGIWQLTPVKNGCLRHCRSPSSFLSRYWRPGVKGAFRMGMQHGLFCLGCCWLLMALLFFGGVMNLIWIVGLALFVLVEKVVPAGVLFGRVMGLLLVVSSVWLAFP